MLRFKRIDDYAKPVNVWYKKEIWYIHKHNAKKFDLSKENHKNDEIYIFNGKTGKRVKFNQLKIATTKEILNKLQLTNKNFFIKITSKGESKESKIIS